MPRSKSETVDKATVPGEDRGASASASKPPPPVSIADLLWAPDPWSDWLEKEHIGMLSSWRLTAVLLREVKVERVVNLLGPALKNADAESRHWISSYLRQFPLPEGVRFGFEHWLEIWHREESMEYGLAACRALSSLDGSPDARMFASVVDDFNVNQTALLWFMLGGIQEWKHQGGDRNLIDPDARWMVDIYPGADRWDDPLEVLFVFFYKRFRAGRSQKTKPLPRDMAKLAGLVELLDDHSAPCVSTGAKVLLSAALRVTSYRQQPTLGSTLGSDSRCWPEVASDVSALRKQGLMEQSSFVATPAGMEEALVVKQYQDTMAERWASAKFHDTSRS